MLGAEVGDAVVVAMRLALEHAAAAQGLHLLAVDVDNLEVPAARGQVVTCGGAVEEGGDAGGTQGA